MFQLLAFNQSIPVGKFFFRKVGQKVLKSRFYLLVQMVDKNTSKENSVTG